MTNDHWATAPTLRGEHLLLRPTVIDEEWPATRARLVERINRRAGRGQTPV